MERARKSTIVRAQTTAGRAAFIALERLAPGVGARWAESVWFTVPAAARRLRPTPAGGERIELRFGPDGMEDVADDDTAGPDGASLDGGGRHGAGFDGLRPTGTIVAEAWGSGPPVYLVHGWGGQRSDLAAWIAPLTGAGHRVVAFDGPGHGESAGRQTTLVGFADVLAALVRREGAPHAVIAHSAGSLATAYAADRGLPVGRLAFVGAPEGITAALATFARLAGYGPRTAARLDRRLRDRVGPLTDYDVPVLAARLPDPPPLLLVHDRRDKEASHTDSAAIAAAWPGARLVSTDGLGHRRILRDPSVVSQIVEYVTAATVHR